MSSGSIYYGMFDGYDLKTAAIHIPDSLQSSVYSNDVTSLTYNNITVNDSIIVINDVDFIGMTALYVNRSVKSITFTNCNIEQSCKLNDRGGAMAITNNFEGTLTLSATNLLCVYLFFWGFFGVFFLGFSFCFCFVSVFCFV